MLTLNQPIRLQSAVGMLSVRDDFGDRIRENYSMLSVQFTPKELLLLMSSPPEETEEQPTMTTLVTQNKVSMYQGVSLEVVNHIVNRILLTQNTPFTYQDTVYISSMLRKAGVTDVSLFMRQVHQLVEQSDSIRSLTALYQVYQGRLPAAVGVVATPEKPAPQASPEEKETTRERYFLHSDIYRRLQTSSIYREICALFTSTLSYNSSVQSREMRVAEHFRAASQLRLAELRQRTVDRDHPMTLQHIQNHYERGDLLPAPENEEQVFSRLAEAVLYNTVAKSLSIAIHRSATVGIQNLDLSHALQQSIDNTVFRFENWYAASPNQGGNVLHGDEVRTTLLTQEQNLLEQLLQRTTQETHTHVQQGESVLEKTRQAMSMALQHVEREPQPIEVPTEVLRETLRQVLTTVRADVLPQQVIAQAAAQLTHRVTALTEGTDAAAEAPQEAPAPVETVLLQHEQSEQDTVLLREQFDQLDAVTRETLEQRYQQRVQEVRKRFGTVSQLQLQRIMTEILQEAEVLEREQREDSQTSEVTEHNTLAQNTREIIERMRRMRSTYQSDHTVEHDAVEQVLRTEQSEQASAQAVEQTQGETAQSTEVTEQNTLTQNAREMIERMHRTRSTYQSDHNVEHHAVEQTLRTEQNERETEVTRRETTQVQTQTLREQLDRIDRRNREMLERLQRARIQENQVMRREVRQGDAKRAIQDALRALDHPEQVLGEMMAQPTPEKPKLQLSPDARTLLSQTDEQTRQLLEAVMQYEADPSAGLQLHVKPASLASFNAAAAQAEVQPVETVQALSPQQTVTEELVQQAAHEVVRHVLPPQAVRQAAVDHMQPPRPVEFVHKTEQRAINEELLEQINQQRQTVREVEQTQVVEQHERMQTQQIEQTQQRTIERMSEDVTELINHTLARQLGTISDKVYSQMEKRLRMERARRGR